MFKPLLLSFIIAISSITSAFAATVNINQADIATLAENLKGIGIKKAKAIVDYRQENGDFNSIEDITNVKGIGLKTLEKNREYLAVKNPEEEKSTENKKEDNKMPTEKDTAKATEKEVEKTSKDTNE